MDKLMLSCPEFTPTSSDLQSEFLTNESLNITVPEFKKNGCLILRKAFDTTTIESLWRNLNDRESPLTQERKTIPIELAGAFNSTDLYVNSWAFPLIGNSLATSFILSSLFATASAPQLTDHGNRFSSADLFNSQEFGSLNDKMPPHSITLAIPLICPDEVSTPYRCWPGSHRINHKNRQDLATDGGFAEPRLMAGDCLILDDRLLRCETANPDRKTRWTLHLQYQRPWYRDPIDQLHPVSRPISDEEYEKIPTEIRSLINHMRGEIDWRYYT